MTHYTREGLAHRAAQLGLDLGKNPVRTIRYYTTLGLLHPPQLVGSFSPARYNDGHLEVLRTIMRFKQRGLRLQDIRLRLDAWACRRNLQDGDGREPITRAELAPVLSVLLASVANRKEVWEYLSRDLVDVDGEALLPETREKEGQG